MLTASRRSRMPVDGTKTMIKPLTALATALAVVLVSATLATMAGTHKSTPHLSGTITSWDDMAKQATVKDSTGKETSLGWNEKTTVTGTPKIGEHASVSYTKDKDGKRWTTHVSIGTKPASTNPPAPK